MTREERIAQAIEKDNQIINLLDEIDNLLKPLADELRELAKTNISLEDFQREVHKLPRGFYRTELLIAYRDIHKEELNGTSK